MELVRAMRSSRRFSLREFAARSGVHHSRISEYEHGRREPSLSVLRRLADAAGYDLDVVATKRVELSPDDQQAVQINLTVPLEERLALATRLHELRLAGIRARRSGAR